MQTEFRFADPYVVTIQLLPVFVVLQIAPLLPTAIPVVAIKKETDLRVFDVPLCCTIQFAPRLVVLNIVPFAPAIHAYPIEDDQFVHIEKRLFDVGVFKAYQLFPKLVELKIMPLSPTAKKV